MISNHFTNWIIPQLFCGEKLNCKTPEIAHTCSSLNQRSKVKRNAILVEFLEGKRMKLSYIRRQYTGGCNFKTYEEDQPMQNGKNIWIRRKGIVREAWRTGVTPSGGDEEVKMYVSKTEMKRNNRGTSSTVSRKLTNVRTSTKTPITIHPSTYVVLLLLLNIHKSHLRRPVSRMKSSSAVTIRQTYYDVRFYWLQIIIKNRASERNGAQGTALWCERESEEHERRPITKRGNLLRDIWKAL